MMVWLSLLHIISLSSFYLLTSPTSHLSPLISLSGLHLLKSLTPHLSLSLILKPSPLFHPSLVISVLQTQYSLFHTASLSLTFFSPVPLLFLLFFTLMFSSVSPPYGLSSLHVTTLLSSIRITHFNLCQSGDDTSSQRWELTVYAPGLPDNR